MKHFDSHAYRTEDEAGVWEFARGSMRTYLLLKEKVAAFHADPEITQLLDALGRKSAKEMRARQDAQSAVGLSAAVEEERTVRGSVPAARSNARPPPLAS